MKFFASPIFLGAVLFSAALGCTTQPAVAPTGAPRAEKIAKSDDLALALDSLRKLAQGGDQQAAQRTIYYLNQWAATEKRQLGEWQPDRMVENIPRALRSTPGLERLDDLEFRLSITMPRAAVEVLRPTKVPQVDAQDLSHLQTCLWLHDIATRARKEPPSPLLAEWFQNMEQDVGLPESERLAAAERVFDWTIRNIQLDELPPAPTAATATAGSQTSDPISPALLGEPGPGYTQSPAEILIHGHGDAWERAHVFILLCRQLNIDAVMLGIMEETSAIPRDGWRRCRSRMSCICSIPLWACPCPALGFGELLPWRRHKAIQRCCDRWMSEAFFPIWSRTRTLRVLRR